MPVSLEILPGPGSFQVLHPRAGETAAFPLAGVRGEGEAYALITHSPGPGGKGDLLFFLSNDTFARQGAVRAFVDPEFVRTLAGKMRNGTGAIPRYFQVMLRIKLKGGVTTEINYLMHRELSRR